MREGAVLITGASGYLGSLVVRRLASGAERPAKIVATDVRDTPPSERLEGVHYRRLDVTDVADFGLIAEEGIDTIVHLAAIVTPPPGDSRAIQHAVDVVGTRNLLAACARYKVKRLVYTSSGAAYGYHADAPDRLKEDEPLRGNEVFAYAHNKRLVEEMLAEARESCPALEQLVFRVSTILGKSVSNQITAMFERRLVLGLWGARSPFCFILDEDAADCLAYAVFDGPPGIYNLTGDGVMTLREIAAAMKRRYVSLPTMLVRAALSIAKALKKGAYGPEQTLFLRYRPVMDNARIKGELGWAPSHTSRQAFEVYRRSRSEGGLMVEHAHGA